MIRITRRWVITFALLLAVLLLIAEVVLNGPIAGRILAGKLGALLGADVQIGEFSWSWSGRATLRNISIDIPEGGGTRLASLNEVEVVLSDWPSTSPGLGEIVIRGGDVWVREKKSGGFVATKPRPKTDGIQKKMIWPSLEVEDVRLRLEGEGPLNRAIRLYVVEDKPLLLDKIQLKLNPSVDSENHSFDLVGRFSVMDVGMLNVEGDWNPSSGTVNVLGHAMGIDLGSSLEHSLHPRLSRYISEYQVEGSLDLRTQMKVELGTAPEVTLDVRLNEGRFKAPQVPFPFESVETLIRLSGESLLLSYLRADINGSRIDGLGRAFSLFDDPRFDFELKIHDLSLEKTVAPLVHGTPAEQSLSDLSPTGIIDLEAHIESTSGNGRPQVSSWRVMLQGVSISYDGHFDELTQRNVGFPYRVDDVWGEVRGTQVTVELDHLRGTAGEGPVEIDGHLQFGGVDIGHDIRVRADAIRADDGRLRHAIEFAAGTPAAEIYDAFQVSGVVQGSARIFKEKGAPPESLLLDISVRDVNAEFRDFPYALENVAGRLVIDSDGVKLQHFKGSHGRARVNIDGAIKTDSLSVTIQGEDLLLDETFRRVLVDANISEPLEAWELLQPEALVREVTCRLEKDGESPFSIDVFGTLARSRFKPRDFPLPISEVSGAFRFGNMKGPLEISIPRLTGRSKSAEVTAVFGFRDGESSDLQVWMKGQEIEPEFVEALGSTSEGVAKLLEDWTPLGTLAIHYQASGLPESRMQTIALGVKDGSFHLSEVVGERIENLEGEIQVTLDERLKTTTVSFEEMRGELRSAETVLKGELSWIEAEGPTGYVQAGVFELPLDPSLLLMLPESVHAFLVESEAEGSFDVSPLRLTFEAPTNSPANPDASIVESGLTFNAELILRDVSLSKVVPIHGVHGRVAIRGGMGSEGTYEFRGATEGLTLRIDETEFQSIQAQFRVDPNGLTVDSLGALVAGGQMPRDRNYLRVRLEEPKTFEVDLAFENANLRSIVGEQRSPEDLAGQLSASFFGRGLLDAPHRLEGRGRVDVVDGHLWELPVFSILNQKGVLRRIGLASLPVFREGYLDFRVEQGQIVLDDLSLESSVLDLGGHGSIGPSGISLSILPAVTPRIPIVSAILDPIVRVIEEGTLAFQLQGPFSNPEVNWNPRLLDPFGKSVEAPDRPLALKPGRKVMRRRF